jgi:hypothetical protein
MENINTKKFWKTFQKSKRSVKNISATLNSLELKVALVKTKNQS